MPVRPVEAMFNTRNNLNKLVANQHQVTTKHFDLHRKQMLYGKIDHVGDAIVLESNLEQIHSGRVGTEFAVDFVVDAFNDLRAFYQQHILAGAADKVSLYGVDLRVTKAWRLGDPLFEYDNYITKIYTIFVQEYLRTNRRHEKIKNFYDFTKEFFVFMLDEAYYFPITLTGFMLSYHCSPFASGLMIEIARQKHGVQNNKAVFRYASDPNYQLLVEMAKKFGFMVDINAPWRLVFNIASGNAAPAENSDIGGRKYMGNYGITYENVFDFYYQKTHLREIENLRKIMYNSYESFYQQFSTYETLRYYGIPGGDCLSMKVVNERKDREPPPLVLDPDSLNSNEADEYFLKMIMKLRLAETKNRFNIRNCIPQINKMLYHYRNNGPTAALNHINELTKGFHVVNFNRRGKYWYGVNLRDYENKKLAAKEGASDPSAADHALTATKNTI